MSECSMGLDLFFFMLGMAVLLYAPAFLLIVAAYLDKRLESPTQPQEEK
jgi:hypothetical protein